MHVHLQMLLHSPVETPKLSFFGFAIRPGTENFITIQPQVRRSTPRVSKIALRKRQCYFSFERSLRFYRTYTQHNCMQECEANYTLSLCSCVLYHMPSKYNKFSSSVRANLSCHVFTEDDDTKICGKQDEKCANDARGSQLSSYRHHHYRFKFRYSLLKI